MHPARKLRALKLTLSSAQASSRGIRCLRRSEFCHMDVKRCPNRASLCQNEAIDARVLTARASRESDRLIFDKWQVTEYGRTRHTDVKRCPNRAPLSQNEAIDALVLTARAPREIDPLICDKWQVTEYGITRHTDVKRCPNRASRHNFAQALPRDSALRQTAPERSPDRTRMPVWARQNAHPNAPERSHGAPE